MSCDLALWHEQLFQPRWPSSNHAHISVIQPLVQFSSKSSLSSNPHPISAQPHPPASKPSPNLSSNPPSTLHQIFHPAILQQHTRSNPHPSFRPPLIHHQHSDPPPTCHQTSHTTLHECRQCAAVPAGVPGTLPRHKGWAGSCTAAAALGFAGASDQGELSLGPAAPSEWQLVWQMGPKMHCWRFGELLVPVCIVIGVKKKI